MHISKRCVTAVLVCVLILGETIGSGVSESPAGYQIAFASFGYRNSEVFLADGNGSHAVPFLPHPDNDYNASFSRDGGWIIFTSHRGGSADIYRAHPDGTGLERLTDDPAYDDQAALSPDGSRIVFVSSRGGHANLWILEIASRRVQRLTQHAHGDFRPSWSPDGRWIAFSSDRDSTSPIPPGAFAPLHSTELYVIRPDGTGLRRLTHAQAYAGSPSWAPDGSALAYYQSDLANVAKINSPRSRAAVTQIVRLDLDSGREQGITEGEGEKRSPQWLTSDRIAYVSGGPDGGLEFSSGAAGERGDFGRPGWSADGRRLVFHRDVDPVSPPLRPWPSLDPGFGLIRTGIFPSYSPTGDSLVCNSEKAGILHNQILRMKADGSARTLIFSDPKRSALAPVWSPQGDRIAFGLGSYFAGLIGYATARLAVINADGTGFETLTEESGNAGFPSWSPDGRRIAYRSSSKTGGKTLSILELETRRIQTVTDGAHNDNFPAWSPQGDRILFASDRDGDWELYTIRTDGTDLKRLTHSPGNDGHAGWSPDGRWIVFSSLRGGFKDESLLFPRQPNQAAGDIYVMRADGSDVRRLTDDQFEEATPAFRPTPLP